MTGVYCSSDKSKFPPKFVRFGCVDLQPTIRLVPHCTKHRNLLLTGANRVRRFIVGLTNNQPQRGVPLDLNRSYTVCGQYPGDVESGATVYQPCASGLQQYRYVIIQTDSAITGDQYMNICEVEVFSGKLMVL